MVALPERNTSPRSLPFKRGPFSISRLQSPGPSRDGGCNFSREQRTDHKCRHRRSRRRWTSRSQGKPSGHKCRALSRLPTSVETRFGGVRGRESTFFWTFFKRFSFSWTLNRRRGESCRSCRCIGETTFVKSSAPGSLLVVGSSTWTTRSRYLSQPCPVVLGYQV